MLEYITKADIWRQLDAGLHTELGWSQPQIQLKTWQDMAVYERLRTATGLRIAEIGGGASRILPRLAGTNTCVNVDKFAGQNSGPASEQVIDGVTNVLAFAGEFSPALPDNSFDVVFSVNVVEHIPHTLAEAFMADLLRILKPGGVCYHAIGVYVGDIDVPATMSKLRTYAGWLSGPGVEPLEPARATDAVFRSAMASNPDLLLWQWGRVNPALNETRCTTQSVSLFMGFRKSEGAADPVVASVPTAADAPADPAPAGTSGIPVPASLSGGASAVSVPDPAPVPASAPMPSPGPEATSALPDLVPDPALDQSSRDGAALIVDPGLTVVAPPEAQAPAAVVPAFAAGPSAAKDVPVRSLAEFRAFIELRKMLLEAIVADVYSDRCRGRSGFVLFDGGAHRAWHALRMLDLAGCEKVYAVEADPFMAETCAQLLQKQAPEAADRVQLVRKALQENPRRWVVSWQSSSSHTGRSSLISDNPAKSTIWAGNPEMDYRPPMMVPATTIDLVLRTETRPLPFLKLDLEGADLMALKGAEETLRIRRPVVVFENSVHAPRVHGFDIGDMAAYFEQMGYVPMNFVGEPMGPENWFGFHEAWAVPREDVDWLQRALARVIVHYMAET